MGAGALPNARPIPTLPNAQRTRNEPDSRSSLRVFARREGWHWRGLGGVAGMARRCAPPAAAPRAARLRWEASVKLRVGGRGPPQAVYILAQGSRQVKGLTATRMLGKKIVNQVGKRDKMANNIILWIIALA